MFEALLRSKTLDGKDLGFLKGIFCGGDHLSAQLKQRMDAFLRQHHCSEQMREGYGATECVAASCLTPRHFTREGSIGIPFPDTFYKIVTPGTTHEVTPGTDGEICISGPTVMLGYLDDPQETATALQTHADGKTWLHTGDLGCMDTDGFVYFGQRLKRVIVTCGYNVYPVQIENILQAHHKVCQCCCIGVPDAYRGQRVIAYVVVAPGTAPTEALKQELLAHCAQHIAKYALPRELVWRTELPKTLVGKVAYRVLEEEAAEENQ
jgi:long-chain acyl-CoA synthetase